MLMKKNVTIMSIVYLLVLFIAGTIIFGTVAFTAHEPDHVPGVPPDNVNPIDDLQSQIASNDDDIADLQDQDTLLQSQIDSQNAELISAVANLQAQLDELEAASGNIADLENRISLLEQSLMSNNQSPIVDAGTDQQIMISQIADLPGIVTDDDLVLPLTTTWSQISGPGNALFVDPFFPNTQVQFDQTGTYELKLTAFDGIFAPSDNVIVNVFVDNDPPLVDAGETQVIVATPEITTPFIPLFAIHSLTCTGQLAGTATDDDLPQPLTITWTHDAPPSNLFINFIVEITDPTSLNTDVTIIASRQMPLGSDFAIDDFDITFTLEVSDGFHTVTDTVQVICDRPF